MTRQNKLDQAISVVKAIQSGLWHMASDGTELERTTKAQKPVYDADAIAAELVDFVKADEDWKVWFAAERIHPLCIVYDDLSADPYAQLSRIVERLGLDYVPADKNMLPVAKFWGAGITASSDGQFFPASRQGEAINLINAKYGNEPGLKVRAQYADTGGFTDHVFAVTSLLGYQFIQRIRDLSSKRLYIFDPSSVPKELKG